MRFEMLPASLLGAVLLLATHVSATDTYDYVIVGAGPGGLLLANRLSKNPYTKVAVIDPGADQQNNTQVSDPNQWFGLTATPVNWAYTSLPQTHAANQTITFHAGKGLGGSTLINGKANDHSRCIGAAGTLTRV
jgi:choline dehydrogenase-like flavoprotein